MHYNGEEYVLLLTKNNTIKETFRSILFKFSTFNISLQSNLDVRDRNIRAIFIDQFDNLNNLSSLKHIGDLRKEYPFIPIVVISNGYSNTKGYFVNGADYVLQKPINMLLLEALLYKILTKLKDSKQAKIYHGIVLYKEENYAYYNKCKILLSEIETHIFSILLDRKTFVSISVLKIFLFKITGQEVSETYVRVNISRLRLKLKEVSGLNLIKNKYSKGYYISI